jgi:hypothetical protein
MKGRHASHAEKPHNKGIGRLSIATINKQQKPPKEFLHVDKDHKQQRLKKKEISQSEEHTAAIDEKHMQIYAKPCRNKEDQQFQQEK